MNTIRGHLASIRSTLPEGVELLCVSKFHPAEAILEAYEAGERDFGESRVQELLLKYEALPKDIRWHFIGHLQTNKVKQIVPFVHLIHSVDSEHLLECINREAEKAGYDFPNIVWPSVYISPYAKVGRGCILLNNVVIQNAAVVGQRVGDGVVRARAASHVQPAGGQLYGGRFALDFFHHRGDGVFGTVTRNNE